MRTNGHIFEGDTIDIGNGYDIEVVGYRCTQRNITIRLEGFVDFRIEIDETHARALAAQLIAAADHAEGR